MKPARRHDPRRGRAARGWTRLADRVCVAPRTRLMEVARRGSREILERCIAEGASLETRDRPGRTALHHAVLGERPENAACLLAYGADPHATDRRGRTPLGLAYADLPLLHRIRQHYRRFRPRASKPLPECSARAAELLAALRRDGIVRVPGLVRGAALDRMRGACQAFVDAIDRELAAGRGVKSHYDEEAHWWPRDAAYVTNNAFKYAPDLALLCADPLLLEVAIHYLGGDVLIQRGVGMRYLPATPSERDMFAWHHDMEERRLKAMVLLTDVSASDQPMSYARGTQNILHPYEMFFRNDCPLEYCREHVGEPGIFQATGHAGDVILFDSNGAHRGNRRTEAAVRDAFFVEYTTDPSDVWGGDLPDALFEGRPELAALFARMRTVRKAWERPGVREAPTWVENLPYPKRWLRDSAGRGG